MVDAAAALINEEGPDAFSMRKLAARLGVNPMTLYLRFENRDELLAAVVDQAFATVELPPVDQGSWEERSLGLARAIRRSIRTHQNLLPMLTSHERLLVLMGRVTDRGLALMREAGLDGDDAVHAFRLLFWQSIALGMLAEPMARAGEHGNAELLQRAERTIPGGLTNVAEFADRFGGFDAEALADDTTRAMIHGLVTR